MNFVRGLGCSALIGSAGGFLGSFFRVQADCKDSCLSALAVIDRGYPQLGGEGGLVAGALSAVSSGLKACRERRLRGQVRELLCKELKVDPRVFEQIDKKNVLKSAFRISRFSLCASFVIPYAFGYQFAAKRRS